MSLSYISQQFTIYVGLFFIIIGVVGNTINIWIFSSVRSYRTAPCTFYFLIASIYNFAYITINLPFRILSIGFGIDLTQRSIFLCKFRQICLSSFCLISLSCACLSTIDQFFVTSQNANLRRLSNIKLTHRISIIVMIIWFLHGIPFLLFYNISPITAGCVNTNTIYAVYVSIYFLIILCIIPVILMTLFGYLTYNNIHLTRALAERQADRQLVRMLSIQIILVVICYVPNAINTAYGLITSGVSKDANRLLIESFSSNIINLLTYTYYSVCLLHFFCELIKQILLFRQVVTCL